MFYLLFYWWVRLILHEITGRNSHVWVDKNLHEIFLKSHQHRWYVNAWTGIVNEYLIESYLLSGLIYKWFLGKVFPNFFLTCLTEYPRANVVAACWPVCSFFCTNSWVFEWIVRTTFNTGRVSAVQFFGLLGYL